MKKWMLTGLFILMLLLTGCQKKDQVLECNGELNGLEVTTVLNYDGKEKVVTDGKANYRMDLSEDIVDTLDDFDFCFLLNDTLGDGFKDCKSSYVDNVLNIDYVIDVEGLEKDENMNFDRKMTLEDAKKELEKQLGITCVIKDNS